jgi:hypothetical protein
MTYREAIQIQIKALQEIYDNAGALRDVATGLDKEAYNFVRTYLPSIWAKLQRVDNSLNDLEAKEKLNGNYSININSKDI